MREDIKQLLKSRPLWHVVNDRQYQEIQEACDYAEKTNNKMALEELKRMLEERKQTILNNYYIDRHLF